MTIRRLLPALLPLILLLIAPGGEALASLQVLGGTNFSVGVLNNGTARPEDGTDFGSAVIPGSVTKTFRLKNNSSSSVTLTALSVTSGPAFDLTSGGVSGSFISLGANATRDFTVRFEPTSAGNKSGTVAILAIGEPAFVVNLAGEAVGQPEIVVRGRPIAAANYVNIADGDESPTSADGTAFGSWDASAGSLTRTFEIENTGTASLDIDSIAVAGNSTAFSITGAPSAVGVGQKQTFSVKFNPGNYGDFLSTVTIQNNDANEDPFTFDVSGIGRGSGIVLQGGAAQTQLILNGDDTPSATQGTDFGTVVAGSAPISMTFKITNLGNEDLVFTSITENANAFSITSAPAPLSRLAPNASTTFNVVLDTSVAGTKYGTVIIATNDPNDGVFAFDVTAVATGTPEIVVEGEEPVLKSRSNIADGDTTPTGSDGTAFGSRGVSDGGETRTFYIRNTGTARLTIDSITDGSSHFSIGGAPASVGANGEQSFTVTFNPTAIGTHTATITIHNDDANEDPFTFAVSGVGTGGMAEVSGGVNFGTVIASGDTTPSAADNTDFGTVAANSGSVTKAFRIANRGNANLLITTVVEDGAAWSLSNVPVAVSLAPDASRDFNVVLAPTSAGPKSATITVLTNDPAVPTYTFAVSATATGAALMEVEGSVIAGVFAPVANGSTTTVNSNGTDFGSHGVSAGPLTRLFRIRNVGSALLTIDSITEGSPNFSVGNIPESVPVNQTREFTVTFDPASWGQNSPTS
ncbi:MAG: choice-of-anchor D domain-containing protein [Verrucomicrobiales bacterium]